LEGNVPANVIFETTENEGFSVLGLPFVTME